MSEIMEALMLMKAEGFCEAAHFGQKRKTTGEDYSVHPIRVANILSARGYKGVVTQCAALLHDVIEDTAITKEYIARNFGDDVAELVDWLTKRNWTGPDGRALKRWEKKELEADRLKSAPVLAKTIKLADRLDNMSIIVDEPDFAPIFVAETRHLLDYALKEGDEVLWARVDKIVCDFQQQNA